MRMDSGRHYLREELGKSLYLQVTRSPDISRRDLLRVLGALGVTSITGLTLKACSKSSPECTKPSPHSPLPTTSPPSLAQLRNLIRSSPDHLQARAEEAVSTKNFKCIAEFVRDHIAVLPPFFESDGGVYSSRWGIEGTIRAGAGTLRDRAELMVAMLGAAGIPAQVRLMDIPSNLNAKEMYRLRHLEFSIGEDDLKAMVDALQKEKDVRVTPGTNKVEEAETARPADFGVDADPKALVENVAKVITTAIDGKMGKLPDYDLPVPRQIPVVTLDGNTNTVLVALGTTATRTDLGDTTKLGNPSRYPLPTIEFSVTAFLNPRPGGGRPRVAELVKSSWPVKDVVGRQVQLLFTPPQGSDALLQAPLSSYPARIPFIRVQPRPHGDLDVRQFDFERFAATTSAATATAPATTSAEDTMPLVATGSLFTIDGEVLVDAMSQEPAKDPAIVSLGEKQSEVESQRVAKIDAAVNAASFPDIEVMLSVTDAKGHAIDGLGMSAFQVSDGGQPCQPILVANRQVQRKPRVLVLYDGSGSITESFSSADKRTSFNRSLAQALIDAASSQPFDVQVIPVGGGSSESGWKAPSLDELANAMELSSDSTIWSSFLNGALDDDPAVIIMVSDFEANDQAQAASAKARISRAKIPIMAVTTGKVKEEVLTDLLESSSGQRFAATDQKLPIAIKELVSKFTKTQRAYSYRFQYAADRKGTNPRNVQVTMRTRPQVGTSVHYPVPVEKDRVLPASVTGLYLTISVGGVTERRHLGGIQFSQGGSISQDPFDPVLIAEARNALNGFTTVTVEPASPTLGAVLEDVVTSFQSIEPLVTKKWTMDDAQAFKTAAAKVYRYPMDLAQLLVPPPASYSDPNVVPQGLRILVSTEQPQGDALVSRIDIPPGLNQLRISAGNRTVVPSVVRSSLWLSANEALTYNQSAFAQLQGRPLHLMQPFTGGGGIPEENMKQFGPEAAARLVRLADQYINYIRLVPTDGGSVAMWVINHESGTVIAVGETGRGEGSHKLSPGEFALALSVAELLSLFALLAATGCELGAETVHPYRCMAYATGAIAATAAGMYVRGHLDYEHIKHLILDRDLPTIFETILTLLHVKMIAGIGLQQLLEHIRNGSVKHHHNPTLAVVLVCATYFLKQFIIANEMSNVGAPVGRRRRAGSQGSSR